MEDAVLSTEQEELREESQSSEATSTASEDYENDNVAAEINYEEIVKADIESLRTEFSELSTLKDITELENPLRYAALRDLGLTPAEAYLATTRHIRRIDNRSHLNTAVPRMAAIPRGFMPEHELEAARELFSDMSDAEIKRLYKKVTK